MIRILITDTHFGWKQNSITWLNSQMSFIDKQLIPLLKQYNKKDIRLIHLGDVFESRSAISPMIAKAVKDKFVELRSLVEDFYIVAGNHDFYSPNSDDIDSLNMVFRDLDINLIVKESMMSGEDAFIPWYAYKDTTWLPDNIKNVYTHADIFGEDRKNIGGVKIFSGHMHIPNIDERHNLYNLGSCYSLNFADSNQDRFIYVYDGKTVKKITNKQSIKFWRVRDKDIFSSMHKKQDYYEIYVNQHNIQDPFYQTRIGELIKQYKNLVVIPTLSDMDADVEHFDSYNIEEICKSCIPEHLKDKFKLVEDRIKNQRQ